MGHIDVDVHETLPMEQLLLHDVVMVLRDGVHIDQHLEFGGMGHLLQEYALVETLVGDSEVDVLMGLLSYDQGLLFVSLQAQHS